MQLIHRNPFELMHRLNRDVDRLLQTEAPGRSRFVPAVDIHEEADRFVSHADLPGVDAAKIDITVDGDVLKIEGERPQAELAENASMHRAERATGRFERHFRLPEATAGDAVDAAYRDGVLTVSIPKAKEAKPYRIEVTAN